MAQRDGDGIGRIVRPGHAVQPEQAARHIHDLMLLRLAVADDGLLDLHGCVFKQRHASRITPRPCETPMPVVILCPQNSSSTATASGFVTSSSCVMSSNRMFSRCGNGSPAGVVTVP